MGTRCADAKSPDAASGILALPYLTSRLRSAGARPLRPHAILTTYFIHLLLTDEILATRLPGVHALGVVHPRARSPQCWRVESKATTFHPLFTLCLHSTPTWRQFLGHQDNACALPEGHRDDPRLTQRPPSRSADISPAGQVAGDDTSTKTVKRHQLEGQAREVTLTLDLVAVSGD